MTSTTPSETATIAAAEEHPRISSSSRDENGHHHSHSDVTAATKPPVTHDAARADLSFPFETTDVDRGGMTDEYRVASKTGFVPADTALRPIPTHVSVIPGALRDPEKAAALKDMKLVTWLENDPEDPRNWSSLYRWCTCSLLFGRLCRP